MLWIQILHVLLTSDVVVGAGAVDIDSVDAVFSCCCEFLGIECCCCCTYRCSVCMLLKYDVAVYCRCCDADSAFVVNLCNYKC